MSGMLSGLKAWALQRFSAVYLGLFLVYFIGQLLIDPPQGHDAWRQWLQHPLMSIATLMFVLALLLHAWIGMRDIFIDYVRHTGWRLGLLSLLLLALIAYGLWAGKLLLLTGMN